MFAGPAKATVEILIDAVTKKGEVYWDMKQFGITLFDTKAFKMHFENLFDGDKLLGKYIHGISTLIQRFSNYGPRTTCDPRELSFWSFKKILKKN